MTSSPSAKTTTRTSTRAHLCVVPATLDGDFRAWVARDWLAAVIGTMHHDDLVKVVPNKTLRALEHARHKTVTHTTGMQHVIACFPHKNTNSEIDLVRLRERFRKAVRKNVDQDISNLKTASGELVPILCYFGIKAYMKKPAQLSL